ncbi:Transcriptional regulator, TetR family [hydrothermal vent metagenome]|uniref:Transcriptional regulator, TetR family n=1 Tax=hydrothermal vent metagenome TaxID=652676 RepID=A0A1W1E7M0_9ZZZZ
MPIIIDKAQKKRDIALACKSIILKQGISDLTISAIAKEASIGKGTFYEYFHSKEEMLFELVNILMHRYNQSQEAKLSQCLTTQEKLKCFASFFYDKETEDLRQLYKMFIAISLLSSHEEMIAFQTECFDYYYHWFERLIDEGVDRGEIVPQTRQMAKGLFAMAKGMFIASETTNSIDNIKEEIERYVDTLFEFVKNKEV